MMQQRSEIAAHMLVVEYAAGDSTRGVRCERLRQGTVYGNRFGHSQVQTALENIGSDSPLSSRLELVCGLAKSTLTYVILQLGGNFEPS